MVADDSGVELHEDVALMDRLASTPVCGGALQHRDDAALDRGGDAGGVLRQRLGGADQFGPFLQEELPPRLPI